MTVEARGSAPWAAALLEQLAAEGGVALPALTREELAVMGALDSAAVQDPDEQRWWSDLSDDARRAVNVTALRGLMARGLLSLTAQRMPDGDDRIWVPAAPQLVLTLTARRHPAFVAVGHEQGAGHPNGLRLYGVAIDANGVRGVVVERVEDSSLHRFALCPPADAADLLAGWAAVPPAADEEDRPGPRVRQVEVVRGDTEAVRLLVLVEAEAMAVADLGDDGEPDEPQPATADTLRARLRALLTPAPLQRGDGTCSIPMS